jgi:hypothetical protein
LIPKFAGIIPKVDLTTTFLFPILPPIFAFVVSAPLKKIKIQWLPVRGF